MPTLILLDVSLSMSRLVSSPDNKDQWQRRQLAIHGINTLLDKIAATNRMEFVSLVIFSSLWEQVVPFTRDIELIKSALVKVGEYDSTNLMSALTGITSLVLDEWGAMTPCQVIIVTDGLTGIGPQSLPNVLQEYAKHDQNESSSMLTPSEFPLPFRFNAKLHCLLLAGTADTNLPTSVSQYQKLVEMNNNAGDVLVPDGPLTMKSVEAMFVKFSERYYHQFKATLRCGHLQSPVILYPPPEPYKMPADADEEEVTLSQTIDVLGFLSICDISSAPVISRHLVVPLSANLKTDHYQHTTEGGADDDDKDEGQRPSFTVLLHGSLKVEGMVALARVGEDWFGILYSWADSKKKSNLTLSPFQPGTENVPWLGSLNHLSPICDFSEPPYGQDGNTSPFPVKQERRSYAQNSTVWIKAPGLQADAQKILRHGRKLPDKLQHFYKELNRLRRMALSLGFTELLTSMATMLEREIQLLPPNSHPEAAQQLAHAQKLLRSPSAREYNTNIMPLRTNSSSSSAD